MNEFDSWNIQKQKIQNQKNSQGLYAKRGDVWSCYLGKNIGYEQNGGPDDFSRPVLIISKFNNQMVWIIPLSTKQKEADFYLNFTDPFEHEVSAILAQLRLVSTKRLKRRIYKLPTDKVKEIRERLKTFL